MNDPDQRARRNTIDRAIPTVAEAEAAYSLTGSSEDFERMVAAVRLAESEARAEAEARQGEEAAPSDANNAED